MTDTMPPAPPPVLEPAAPKRRRGLIAGAIAVAVLLIGGLVFFVADGEEAKAGSLALSFVPGQTERYRIDQTMDLTLGGDLAVGVGGPMTIETSQTVGWKVTDVDDDGVATIRVTTEDLSGTVNGTPVPSMGSTPAVDLRISSSGRILSVGGPALGGSSLDLSGGPFGKLFQMPGTDQFTPLLPPTGQAQPGDTWDTSFSQDVPFGHGSVDVDATSRYDRDETVGGTDTAVIVTDSKLSIDVRLELSAILGALRASGLPTGASGMPDLSGASLSYSGAATTTQTSWLDLANRDLVKTHTEGDLDLTMSYDGVPGSSGGLTMSGTFQQDVTSL